MPRSIEDIIRNAINTGDFTPSAGAGILSSEQARKFIQQTFEATTLGGLVRHEMRTARSGEIDKIGIASRLLREKTEDTDDGYRAGVNTTSIKYACTPVRLPWEITEETLRENIEGQNLENIITNMMTTQTGIDALDLYLNGDEKFARSRLSARPPPTRKATSFPTTARSTSSPQPTAQAHGLALMPWPLALPATPTS